MRSVLINWLLEIQSKLTLSDRTLFMAVGIFDRVLVKKIITRQRLQLLGITSFFIASKFEDVSPPDLDQLVYFCDDIYSREEITSHEAEILIMLDFNLVQIQPMDIYTSLLKSNKIQSQRIWSLGVLLLKTLLFFKHHCLFDPFQISVFAYNFSSQIAEEKYQQKFCERVQPYFQILVQTVQQLRHLNLRSTIDLHRDLFLKISRVELYQ